MTLVRVGIDTFTVWIRCCNIRVSVRTHVRARAGGSRFLKQRVGYHSRSHACTARAFRRQKSAGRDRPGEKREIRVNVRNTHGFAVWEFKRVVYNSKCRLMPIKARCLMTFEIDLNFKRGGDTSKWGFASRYLQFQRKIYKLWRKCPYKYRELTGSKERISKFSPFRQSFVCKNVLIPFSSLPEWEIEMHTHSGVRFNFSAFRYVQFAVTIHHYYNFCGIIKYPRTQWI